MQWAIWSVTMEFNDVLYLSVLIFSICFGKYINQIPDGDKKEKVSTLAGLAIVFLVTRSQCLYPLILVGVNSLFIVRLTRWEWHSYCGWMVFILICVIIGQGSPTSQPLWATLIIYNKYTLRYLNLWGWSLRILGGQNKTIHYGFYPLYMHNTLKLLASYQ